MRKNIHYLKTQIFKLLSEDSELQIMLGGDDRISYKFPNTDSKYPCVTYDIVSDNDVPYDEDQDAGKVTETIVNIVVHDNNETPDASDHIEARIKEILNGNHNYGDNLSLTNNYIICYSGYRIGSPFQNIDPDVRIWTTSANYRITWAPRDQAFQTISAKANIS